MTLRYLSRRSRGRRLELRCWFCITAVGRVSTPAITQLAKAVAVLAAIGFTLAFRTLLERSLESRRLPGTIRRKDPWLEGMCRDRTDRI